MNDEKPSARRHPRRWWQFGLRSLLLLVLLVAVGLLFVRQLLQPYWKQEKTAALLNTLGGGYQTTAGNRWLRLLGCPHNVTRVEMDGGDPDAYLAAVAELPAVELLIVGGLAFNDEHARQLHRMRSLHGVILDSTSVSEEELAALRAALPKTEVYASQRWAIGALAKVGQFQSPLPLGPSQTSPANPATLALRQFVGNEWFDEATVFFSSDRLDDADAAQLRALRFLFLSHSQITDSGVAHLADLRQLETLSLGGTRVSDVGLESLEKMTCLRDLSLERSRVTPAGVAKLRAALPDCRIHASEE